MEENKSADFSIIRYKHQIALKQQTFLVPNRRKGAQNNLPISTT